MGTVVFRLEAYDPEGSPVTYGAIGADHFSVDPVSGNITLIKPLDREEKDTLKFLVSIRDRVDPEESRKGIMWSKCRLLLLFLI